MAFFKARFHLVFMRWRKKFMARQRLFDNVHLVRKTGVIGRRIQPQFLQYLDVIKNIL